MKKILIPTDFSQEAQNAVGAARILALKFKAELILLHSIEVTSSESISATGTPTNFDSYADSMMVNESIGRAKEEMKSLIETCELKGFDVSEIIKIGSPFSHIFDAAKDNGVDFIVMGTKGATGLSEVLIGSNTEKVVRKAKCPVLSIKSSIDEMAFSSIVYATDMGENEGHVIDTLKEIKEAFGSKLSVVWVNTPNNFKSDSVTKPQLREFVKNNGLDDAEIHVFNDVIEEDGIRHFADDINATMIIMGTSSHTGLSRIIRGSIAEDMVNHAKRPVLTVSMKY